MDLKHLMSVTDGSKHTGRATTESSQAGGRKRRYKRSMKRGGIRRKSSRRMHRKKGGSMLATAALPLSLFGLQKFFQTRKGRKDLKKASKLVSKTARRVSRSM